MLPSSLKSLGAAAALWNDSVAYGVVTSSRTTTPTSLKVESPTKTSCACR